MLDAEHPFLKLYAVMESGDYLAYTAVSLLVLFRFVASYLRGRSVRAGAIFATDKAEKDFATII